jgi:hypothetical protein
MENAMPKRAIIWASFIVLLLYAYFPAFDFSQLTATHPFEIGEATAKGISINGRITTFYTTFFVYGLFFLILVSILKKLNSNLAHHPFVTWIDGLLFLGVSLGICQFFHMHLLNSMQFIGASALLIFLIGSKKQLSEHWKQAEFWMTIGFVFISNYSLFHSAIIGFLVAMVAFTLAQSHQKRWRTALFSTLFGLPISMLVGVELSFILNQHCISIPSTLVVILPIVCLSFALFYFKKIDFLNPHKTIYYRFFFPLGIIAYTFLQSYTPIINQPTELFEYANKMNPVMQLIHFGEIPIIDNLSSHLVSDFFWEMIYTLFNGPQSDASILIYSELTHIVLVLSIYYYLKAQFGNHPWIVLVLLLSPFLFAILPLYYALCFIPLTRLLHALQHFSSRNLHSFYWSIIAVAVWRIDLGISLTSTLFLLLPFWWYSFPENRLKIAKITSVYLLSGLIVGISALIFIPEQLMQMKGYFGASQAHGLSVLTYSESVPYFFNYFLLPLLVVAIGLLACIQLVQKKDRMHHLTILFIGSFFVFNLQRGLVRHSFAENNETQIASLGLLVIVLTILHFWFQQKQKVGLLITFSSIFGIFVSIHTPSETSNLFERGAKLSLNDLPRLQYSKVKRVLFSEEFEQTTQPIVSFLKHHLKKGETFIDFSNNPMLYYYTQKNVPSYFNQYLQNTVTDDLQRYNLFELKTKQIPLVVLEKNPNSFFDQLDGIPNKIRYHLITAFIYAHYQPWKQIGGFCVWKRKVNPTKKLPSLPLVNEQWDLGYIPYFWKETAVNHRFIQQVNKVTIQRDEHLISWENPLAPGSFLTYWINSPIDQQMTLHAEGIQLKYSLKKGNHRYRIPLSCSENLIQSSTHQLTVESNAPVQMGQPYFVKLKP